MADEERAAIIGAAEFEKLALEHVTDTPGADVDIFRAMMGLTRVSARLAADFEAAVHRPAGITWPGFRILFCLWTAGPLQTRELARLVFTTPPTVSSVLNTLERKGYVSRHRLEHDQRLVEVRLTPAGLDVAAKAFRVQHERERAWLAGIDPVLVEHFVEVLELLAVRPRPAAGRKPRKAQTH